MLETDTSSASPIAASQAAKTSTVIGIIMESVNWAFSEVRAIIRKIESIMPSIHKSVDIICERKIKVPNKDRKKAKRRLMKVRVMWYPWVQP